MQLGIDLESSEKVISLDRIIDMVLENAETGQHPQFEYMRIYEQRFMTEIKKYSQNIRKPELSQLSGQQMEAVAESQSSDLHAVMADACIVYLKHGMKLGAGLVVELLR